MEQSALDTLLFQLARYRKDDGGMLPCSFETSRELYDDLAKKIPSLSIHKQCVGWIVLSVEDQAVDVFPPQCGKRPENL